MVYRQTSGITFLLEEPKTFARKLIFKLFLPSQTAFLDLNRTNRIRTSIILRRVRSLKPPVVVEVEMADLLERMEARIELRRMILSLRRSRDLQTQQDKQAITRMRQPIVIAMAATARGSEAQANWSICSSASMIRR